MAEVMFNHASPRAREARVGRAIHRLRYLLVVAIVVCLVSGALLTGIGMKIGIIIMALASVPYMVYAWNKHQLTPLPIVGDTPTIEGWLDGDIMARLPQTPRPVDIAEAVGPSAGSAFMAVRFGITPNMLAQLAADTPADTETIWRLALDIRERAGASSINGAVLAAAIVLSHPQHEAVLANIHLDDTDVIDGVKWEQHVRDLVAEHSAKRRTGGIARDWSYGYIPLLGRFGSNISSRVSVSGSLHVEIAAHVQAIEQMVKVFDSQGRQNVALIGQSGAGKTTLIEAFAAKLMSGNVSSRLQYRQVILLDASTLLAAAPGRGELESLVMRILSEALRAKNVIIALDNAQLFFEAGTGSIDLSNVLQPVLDGGALPMILAMDEQRYLQIMARNAALGNALQRISVAPADMAETILVMQDQLLVTEYQQKVRYTYQALKEIYRLSERYVHELAMPGRAIKLLEASANYADGGLVTVNAVQTAIERTMDVKVSVASGAAERETLLNLEDKIHARMINQTRAVGVVSDALRRARAGVRNEKRPIGTFLFLGPTGVGKTELAKALADVYFGGEDRIVRLDLNEFVSSSDVTRLIADGAEDASSLTAQVMKQPFSVVLLDEIEKAHTNVLTTLLQLLDEGILRDEKNREISFRDAIVIATSNAGADTIREYIERGYKLEQFEQTIVNQLISSGQFKPEFLNRFDEIVVFTPLEKTELLKVVDLMIAGVNKTLAPQKIVVDVEPDAKQLLVDRGYDPRLGARPMRRVVQRAVENTVAKQVLAGNAPAGTTITISADQVSQALGLEQALDTQPPEQLPPQQNMIG